MDRRSFLGALGVTALAGLPTGAAACGGSAYSGSDQMDTSGIAANGRSSQPGPLGVQLYTLRSEMARDFDATLARVAEIGYREVEFAGYFGKSAEQVRASLAQAGLSAPSTHAPLEALEQRWDETLEFAGDVGHRYIVVPWLPAERRRTLDDYRRLAGLFNDFGARVRQSGFSFAYHNHDFEFAPIEGRVPFDLLLEETDADLVKIELDLYWITKAGHDPFDYFARHPGRFPMVHLKDTAGSPEHRMVDIGSGTIDRGRIVGARERLGIRHMFVEHDESADPFASITTSFENLSRLDVR